MEEIIAGESLVADTVFNERNQVPQQGMVGRIGDAVTVCSVRSLLTAWNDEGCGEDTILDRWIRQYGYLRKPIEVIYEEWPGLRLIRCF